MDQTAGDRLQREIESEAVGGKGQSADGGLTPVMVRLAAADLETVDTLITAGLADSQAEAIRWALTRIRKLPAYERLRKRAAKSKGLAEKQANAEYAELLGKLETYLAGQAWDVRLSTRLTSRARP